MAVTEPGGLIIGLSPAVEGMQNDMVAANRCDLNAYLLASGLKAMTDRGFARRSNVSPFPKKSQEHNFFDYEMKAMAAIRTAGEWPFGQMQLSFPYLVQKWKLKLFHTCPGVWLVTAIIISNCIRLEHGTNNNYWFGTFPVTSYSRYLRGEV